MVKDLKRKLEESEKNQTESEMKLRRELLTSVENELALMTTTSSDKKKKKQFVVHHVTGGDQFQGVVVGGVSTVTSRPISARSQHSEGNFSFYETSDSDADLWRNNGEDEDDDNEEESKQQKELTLHEPKEEEFRPDSF